MPLWDSESLIPRAPAATCRFRACELATIPQTLQASSSSDISPHQFRAHLESLNSSAGREATERRLALDLRSWSCHATMSYPTLTQFNLCCQIANVRDAPSCASQVLGGGVLMQSSASAACLQCIITNERANGSKLHQVVHVALLLRPCRLRAIRACTNVGVFLSSRP